MAKKSAAKSGAGGMWVSTVVLLGVVGGVGAFAWKRLASRSPVARALAYLPRDSAIIAAIDFDATRASTAVQGPRDNALRDPDLQRQVAEVRTACGFDPTERIESAAVGFVPAPPPASPEVAVFVGVRASRANVVRCVEWARTNRVEARGLTPTGPVSGHPAYELGATGATSLMLGAGPGTLPPSVGATAGAPPGREPFLLVVTDDGLLFSQRSTATRVLANEAPAAAANRRASLEAAADARASGTLLFSAADLAALRAADPTHFAVDAGLGAALIPWLPYANSAQTAAFSVVHAPQGLRLRTRVTLPTAAEAQGAALAFTSWWGSVRGMAAMALGLVSSQLTVQAQGAVAANPSLAPEVTRAQAGVQLALGLLNRVNPVASDREVRIDAELSPAELQTLADGARAANALSSAGVRPTAPTNALPGLTF